MLVAVEIDQCAATMEYTMPQTQDMAPHPVTVYRHLDDLSLGYPFMCVVITTFDMKVLYNAGSVGSCIVILEYET